MYRNYRVNILVLSSSTPAVIGDNFCLLHLQSCFGGKYILLFDLILYLIFFSFPLFIGFVDLPMSRCRFMISTVVKVAVSSPVRVSSLSLAFLLLLSPCSFAQERNTPVFRHLK